MDLRRITIADDPNGPHVFRVREHNLRAVIKQT